MIERMTSGATSPHSEQHDVGDAFCIDLVRKPEHRGKVVALLHRQRQPAEPPIFVGAGPDGRIAIPDAAHDFLLAKYTQALAHLVREVVRKAYTQIGCRHDWLRRRLERPAAAIEIA